MAKQSFRTIIPASDPALEVFTPTVQEILPTEAGIYVTQIDQRVTNTYKVTAVTNEPGGEETQVQFKSNNEFAGDAGFTYNAQTDSAILTGSITVGGIYTDHLLFANGIERTFTEAYSNSNVAAFLPTYAGTLTATSVSGTVPGANIDGAVTLATTATTAGTVTTAAQPNITSLGTLTDLKVSYRAVALGLNSGYAGQTANIVAIGSGAGNNSPQDINAVAVGHDAGWDLQGANTVAVGAGAATYSQGNGSIAIGFLSGYDSQGLVSVAIGRNAGFKMQGANAVAVGGYAGAGRQLVTAYTSGGVVSTTLIVASTTGLVPNMVITGTGFISAQTIITVDDGTTLTISAMADSAPSGDLTFTIGQSSGAIAIGRGAGSVAQGENAIAIGKGAASLSQVDNSIMLNATGANVNVADAGFHVLPVRNVVTSNVAFYNTVTGEVTYGSLAGYAGIVKTGTTTVELLGSAATAGAGARYMVTNSDTVAATNFGNVVANSGSGANTVPVYSDGTSWRIG